ncbi:hypothetical protein [Solimonas marina]|uniref:Uncharacterized protein n=1 Tax=Solimonas marina TaxID=2714601 RepID=A0A969WEE0_9GAMM|nr:hypothetical protein [Solimonas marina]NKF24580.1 hypothetical protein [Solimonas marina]
MTKLTSAQVDLIEKRLEVDGARSIVLLDVGGRKDVPDHEYNANVYCLDDHGNVVWQISAPLSANPRDSFVSLRIDGKKLCADRFFGTEYVVDLDTGEALKSGWHK